MEKMKKRAFLFLTTAAVLLAVSCKAAALKQTTPKTTENYQAKELEYSNNGGYDRLDNGHTAPETAGTLLDRGIQFATRGYFELAIGDFSDAIKQNPYLSEAYILRGKALYASVSDVINIAEKFERVGTHFQAGRQLSKEQTQAYNRAIADFTEAIRLDENNAVAYSDRGDAYSQKGDLDKAIADYNQAIRLNPQYAWAYNDRGNAYHFKGDTDKAIEDYTQAIRYDPQFSYPYHNRGNQYLYRSNNQNKEDLDMAIADFTEAIKLDPNVDDYAYINRGKAYYNKEDYDRAIADYTQAIILNPNYADTYIDRGNAYYKKGDYNQAIADYTQAIILNPYHADPYTNKGDYDWAIADYNRGLAYDNKKDYDRAIADYTQAIKLNPNYAGAYGLRGDAYTDRGKAYYNKKD